MCVPHIVHKYKTEIVPPSNLMLTEYLGYVIFGDESSF